MLPEVLQTGKANPYLEYVEMQEVLIQNELLLLPGWKEFDVFNLPPGGWLAS